MIKRSIHDLTHTGFRSVTKTIKNLSQDSWLWNQDLNSGHSEYEAQSYPLNCGKHLSYFLVYIYILKKYIYKNKQNNKAGVIKLPYFLISSFLLKK